MADAAERRAHRTREILEDSQAIITGDHFVYVNGDHGDGWVAKDLIFPHTERADELCGLLAEALGDRAFDVVCGPATGGLIVSQWTAHHLGLPSYFAEHGKEHGYDPAVAHAGGGPLRPPFVLKRHYDEAVADKRVLVVDDVVNTGESVRETAEAVRAAGGEVATVGGLITRGNAQPSDTGSDDFVYLDQVEIPSWPEEDCDLCKRGVPVNTHYAHGADFVAAQTKKS
jgi:orotate phosphoribosyltransferase